MFFLIEIYDFVAKTEVLSNVFLFKFSFFKNYTVQSIKQALFVILVTTAICVYVYFKDV